MTKKERILGYLKKIYPRSVTNADIKRALGLKNHQEVFYPTRDLKEAGIISARRIGQEWYFKAKEDFTEKHIPEVSPQKTTIRTNKEKTMTSREFEKYARKTFSDKFKTSLSERKAGKVNKRWDMVSPDEKIIGDAKYYTLVRGTSLPPAKFATIAEHVWLLENTKAETKFLVFGNQIEVPKIWLEKYGNLVSDVKFYFLDDNGLITSLN